MPFVPAEGATVARRYTLVSRIAEGGMGDVWVAQHTVTKRRVAIKFLKPGLDEQARRRVIREAQAACAIEHDAVLPIHDVLETDDGEPALVMDLLQGEPLEKRIARDKRLTPAEVATLLLPVAAALKQAHAIGLVHRDLKPANIFLTKGGGVKVLDFGIVKAVDGGAGDGPDTTTGKLIGTPRYMSPEQASGESDIDFRSDVWSLGIVLYEALSGERPVKGDNIGQILKVLLVGKIRPLREVAPDLPEPLLSLVDRMTEREASARSVTMADVEHVLSTVALSQSGAQPAARPSPPSEPTSEPTDPTGRHAVTAATPASTDAPNPGADPSTVGPTTMPRSRPAPSPWLLGVGAVVLAGGVVGTVVLVGKNDGATTSASIVASERPPTTPVATTPAVVPSPASSAGPAPPASSPAPPASSPGPISVAPTTPGAPINYDPMGAYCRANPKNPTCAAGLKRWCGADPKHMASPLCN